MEEEKKGKLLCMLCCVHYNKNAPPGPQKKKKKQSHLGTTIRFKKFCDELECVLAQKRLPRMKMTKARLKGDLNLAYGDLSICHQCMSLICSAVETKEGVKELEEQVTSLQTQILELMKELNVKMGTFLTRMKKIESVVQSSDAELLQEYIEENVSEELRGDPEEFRSRILYAVTDLRLYREELSDKVDCNYLLQRRQKEKLLKQRENLIDQYTQTKIRGEKGFMAATSVHRPALKLKNTGQQTDFIYILENEEPSTPAVKVEVYPDDVLMAEDDNDGFLDDHYHSNDEIEPNEFVEKKRFGTVSSPKPSRSRPRRSVAMKRKLPTSSASSSNDSESSDEDIDDGASENGSNFSDDNFELQKMRQEEQTTPRKLFDNLDLSQMSNFKISVVSTVLKKLEERMDIGEKSVKQNQSDDDAEEATTGEGSISTNLEEYFDDPRNKHLIEYDAETGTFSLESIAIICNEEEESLQCSICKYTIKDNRKVKQLKKSFVPSSMQDHILGKHLEAYRCAFCSAVSASIKQYTIHVNGHKQPSVCDICGKPLLHKDSLRTHKWLHMNEEEKEDAMRRGVPNPQESYLKTKSKPKNIPCSTCGKMFRYITEVRQHEKIHEERDRIPCDKCGKLLLNETPSLSYHLTYSCPGVEHKYVAKACPVCHRTYKTTQIMKNHMKLEHPSEPLPLLTCEVCGRQLKTMSALRKHVQEVHSGVKPFSCGACDAAFTTKRNCQRHEKICSLKNKETECNNAGAVSEKKTFQQSHVPLSQKPSLNVENSSSTGDISGSVAGQMYHHQVPSFQPFPQYFSSS